MVNKMDLKKKKLMSIVIMVIIMFLTVALMITTFSLEYLVGGNLGDSGIIIDGDGKPDINIDINGDGIPDLNIDVDGDGKADINIDTNRNKVADLNIDYDRDGKADINVDKNNDGKADWNQTNKDKNKDGIVENKDTNRDGYPDINIDIDGDGIPDINIDTDGNGKADLNIDYDKDGDADINIDTNKDGKADKNLTNTDSDWNGKVDLNVDTNKDGYPDVNIDINGDGIPDINIDTDINKPDEDIQVVDALLTMKFPEVISLEVTNDDLTKEKVGNSKYISITSEQKSGTISLKSNADTTTCKYDVIYNTEYNYFENKYTMNNGTLGTLKEQLLLSLDGTQMNGTNQTGLAKEIDIIEIKNEETVILKDVLITDVADDYTTNVEWKMILKFNNYRDYNQVNNAGKEAKGKLTFKVTECERTK